MIFNVEIFPHDKSVAGIKRALAREKKYGFSDMLLRHRGKLINFYELKKSILSDKAVQIQQENPIGLIECILRDNDPWDGTIPVVLKSNHKRFTKGTRFDYGFMMIALQNGFNINYNIK